MMSMKPITYCTALLTCFLTIVGCDDNEIQHPDAAITSFSINNQAFDITDTLISFHNDIDIDRSRLTAEFTASGEVKVDNVIQQSGITVNDFTKTVTYTVTNQSGESRNYYVRLTTFTGLPRLYITTEGNAPIESKDDYVRATFRFEPNLSDQCASFETTGGIKGRGTSTWELPKKPSKIKFDNKTAFYNLPPQKEWVLLANYADKTLIRNYLAMYLSEQLKMAFTPTAHFTEVYLNNKHTGNYMITDQIEVKSSRVNVEELADTDTDPLIITGGYLLEIDQRILVNLDEPYFQTTNETTHYPIVVKYPKAPTPIQMNYISSYVNEAESVLYGTQFAHPTEGFRKYFDEEAMIKWYIVSEVFKNVDSRRYSSINIHKSRTGKLCMGPLWDFDLAAGNATHNPDCVIPTGWYIMYNAWFNRMYEDEAFQQKVKQIWKTYREQIFGLLPLIDETALTLKKSQIKNFTIWPDFNEPKDLVVQNYLTYDSQIEYLKAFLTERINWLDSKLNGN